MTLSVAPQHESPRSYSAAFGDAGLDVLAHWFDPSIHAVLDFDHELDVERLDTALRRCCVALPLLVCHLVPGSWRCRWVPTALPARLVDLRTVEDRDAATQALMLGRLPATEGPRVQAALLRSAAGDRVYLRVDHRVSDGGGTKALLRMLARTYRELERRPDARPEPAPLAWRGMDQVRRAVGWGPWLRGLGWGIADLWRFYVPLQPFCPPDTQGAGLALVTRRISGAGWRRARAWAARRGATVNDLIAGATAWAATCVAPPAPGTRLRVRCTADLRRFLPAERREVVSNLSSFLYLCAGRWRGQGLASMVQEVASMTAGLKARGIGLGEPSWQLLAFRSLPHAGLRAFLRLTVGRLLRSGYLPYGFTNLGSVGPSGLDFGAGPPTDGWIVPPEQVRPFYLFGVSGFGDDLVLSRIAPVSGDGSSATATLFEHIALGLEGLGGQGDEGVPS